MPWTLQEFDYSVRVTLASNSIVGAQEPSVALKLKLSDQERGADQEVMLELSEAQVAKLLGQLAVIQKRTAPPPAE